jgi:hypothetical protein
MTNLLFNSGNLTFENAIYQIGFYEKLGPQEIHLFLKNETNSMAIFLRLESTSVNGNTFESLPEMLSALGNPVEMEA